MEVKESASSEYIRGEPFFEEELEVQVITPG
jgi:hypothetical protein